MAVDHLHANMHPMRYELLLLSLCENLNMADRRRELWADCHIFIYIVLLFSLQST